LTKEHDALTGNTAEVYRYTVKMRKPVGAREVQKALNLSSPRLAAYHLEKLEKAGLVKQTPEGFIVDRFVLENFVRFYRLLIPKYFLYFAFFATAMVFQITFFAPYGITGEYVFATGVLAAATTYFGYETIATFLKKEI